MIWCAVAWITDDDIYNELLLKSNNGIQIQILTADEPSNSRLLKNLCDNFEVVKIPQWVKIPGTGGMISSVLLILNMLCMAHTIGVKMQ